MSIYDDSTGLVLHNRLSSQAAVLLSETGVNCSEGGTPIYTDGYFSKGVQGSNGNNIEFPVQNILSNNSVGCIAFWLKPITGFTTNSAVFLLTTQTASEGQVQCDINGGNIRLRHGIWGGTPLTISYSAGVGNFPLNTWTYMSFIWESGGIGGGANTLEMRKDGAIIASSTNALSTANFVSGSNSSISNRVGSTTIYTRAVFSNMKIWNVAKTNFTNRFYEFNGGIEK